MFYLRMDLGEILSLSAPFMFLFLFSIMAMGKATVKTLEIYLVNGNAVKLEIF